MSRRLIEAVNQDPRRGVEDLDDLALVKASVIEVVRDSGVSVLNADDPIVVKLEDRAGGQKLFCSLRADNETIVRHVATRGTAVVMRDGDVVIHSAGESSWSRAAAHHQWAQACGRARPRQSSRRTYQAIRRGAGGGP